MAGLHVPQLRQKLRALITAGHFEDRRAVAAALGRSEVTLRGWENGSSSAPPDTVPQQNAATLIDLFAAALPGTSPARVRDLLTGPAGDLEALLSAGPARSLRALVAREAERSAAGVFLDESGTFSLIRRATRSMSAADFIVPLGRAFRIEFATSSRAPFVISLQSAPGGWGVVPATLERDQNRIHVPGPDAEGNDPFLIEEHETGRHLFVAAQAPQAFSSALHLAGQDGIALDRTLLEDFRQHFEAQSTAVRRLFALEIEFVADGQS